MFVRELVEPYCASVENASGTAAKLRHQINRWLKFGGPADCAGINEAAFVEFRAKALAKPLSPVTIEDTISDIALLVTFHTKIVCQFGKRLKKIVRCKHVPKLAAIAKLYKLADECQFPAKVRNADWTWKLISQEQRCDFMRCLLVLGVWTGLRVSDLLLINWDSITDEAIIWEASKTKKEHRFPISDVVRFHLDRMRAWDRPTVLGIGHTTAPYVREELHRLAAIAGGAKITPQSFRRCAVTSWATIGNGECGRVIHGCGIPKVLKSYYDGEQILRANMDRYPWPDDMLPVELREQKVAGRAELLSVLDRLPSDRIADVIRVARAFAG